MLTLRKETQAIDVSQQQGAAATEVSQKPTTSSVLLTVSPGSSRQLIAEQREALQLTLNKFYLMKTTHCALITSHKLVR